MSNERSERQKHLATRKSIENMIVMINQTNDSTNNDDMSQLTTFTRSRTTRKNEINLSESGLLGLMVCYMRFLQLVAVAILSLSEEDDDDDDGMIHRIQRSHVESAMQSLGMDDLLDTISSSSNNNISKNSSSNKNDGNKSNSPTGEDDGRVQKQDTKNRGRGVAKHEPKPEEQRNVKKRKAKRKTAWTDEELEEQERLLASSKLRIMQQQQNDK